MVLIHRKVHIALCFYLYRKARKGKLLNPDFFLLEELGNEKIPKNKDPPIKP